MRPKERAKSAQRDLFRLKLVNLIDLRHELCRLGERVNWQALVYEFGALYAEHGRPGVPIRLMAGLHYLKHAFGLSDEAVVKNWAENPYCQHFCGEEYFQHRLPIDPSQMTRFRTRLGPSGCEKLLELTITDFELDRPLCLLLRHDRAGHYRLAMANIPHSQLHQVTRPKLAVDGEVE